MIQNFYEQLLGAGLPVTSASDDGQAEFSRSLSEDEYLAYARIIDPVGMSIVDIQKNSEADAMMVSGWSNWNKDRAQSWYNDNVVTILSKTIPETVNANTNRLMLLGVIQALKNLGTMVWAITQLTIAIRNERWPHSQKDD